MNRLRVLVGSILMSTAISLMPGTIDASQPDRALFVSLIQDPPVLSSRQAIDELVGFSKQAGIKTLFVQIYRANKAWFPSKTADDGPYQIALKSIGEDPLALLIRQAHREGIEVHAWLNLLSLAQNTQAPILKKYGPAILTRNLKDKQKLEDYKIDNQYFLEPGDPQVRKELTAVVREILRAYPAIDGIQYDYIRYPDFDPHYGYTKANVARFKKATGIQVVEEKSQVWQDWRREQVTQLLTGLVKTARSLRPDLKVSTTGCMPYVRAFYEANQDWPLWINTGLVDFVTVMSYSPQPAEFKKTIEVAKRKVKDFSKVNIAVGAYKFIHSPEVFDEEMNICEEFGSTCAVFHYGDLIENPALKNPLLESKK